MNGGMMATPLLVAVLLLVVLVFVGGAVVAPGHLTTDVGLRDPSSPCADIAATYPILANNTTTSPEVARMFWIVCQIPEFSTLLQKWGVGNFSLGFELQGTPGTPVDEWYVANESYGVDWVSACTNPIFAEASSCTYTEYWKGNITMELVTGPFTTQHPTTYMGPGTIAPSPPWFLLYGLLASAFGIALLGAVIARRIVRGRHRRGGTVRTASAAKPQGTNPTSSSADEETGGREAPRSP
jgi:hypothetical protein